jgi:hypothetical protein
MAMVMVEKRKETRGKKMLITVKEMNVLIRLGKSEMNVPVSLDFFSLVAGWQFGLLGPVLRTTTTTV